jgi:hypothetical protein
MAVVIPIVTVAMSFWLAILAHMAQRLSMYFIINAIAITKGHVFESAKKNCFFTPH